MVSMLPVLYLHPTQLNLMLALLTRLQHKTAYTRLKPLFLMSCDKLSPLLNCPSTSQTYYASKP